jgi:hypothetical protein
MFTLICIGIVIYYWRDVKDDYIPVYAAMSSAIIIGVELITNLSLLNMLSTNIVNIYMML